jgi:hypothetical protein
MKSPAAATKTMSAHRSWRRSSLRGRSVGLAARILASSSSDATSGNFGGADVGRPVHAGLECPRATLPALAASPFKRSRAPPAPGTAPSVVFPLVDIPQLHIRRSAAGGAIPRLDLIFPGCVFPKTLLCVLSGQGERGRNAARARRTQSHRTIMLPAKARSRPIARSYNSAQGRLALQPGRRLSFLFFFGVLDWTKVIRRSGGPSRRAGRPCREGCGFMWVPGASPLLRAQARCPHPTNFGQRATLSMRVKVFATAGEGRRLRRCRQCLGCVGGRVAVGARCQNRILSHGTADVPEILDAGVDRRMVDRAVFGAYMADLSDAGLRGQVADWGGAFNRARPLSDGTIRRGLCSRSSSAFQISC